LVLSVANLLIFNQIIDHCLISLKLLKTRSVACQLLKVNGETLITASEKADAIATVLARAHNNTMPSLLEEVVNDGCLGLQGNEFNLNASNLVSPRAVMGKKRVYFIHVFLSRLFFKGYLMEMREERRILINKIVAIYASQ
jgi:hypothetical protein